MCGIVGIASRNSCRDPRLLIRQRDTLRHRGPDDAGMWWSADGCIGLAHRRLAIIDLSPLGKQPMQDIGGRLCIVFNGEIYNFKDLRRDLERQGYHFRSQSDTEVILAAYQEWGTDCVQHLNGMFSFALHDREKRRLFLARDRAGEKPLFYFIRNGRMVFASELKALMVDPEFPRHIDYEALDCYLTFGYVPGERCILRGVNKLPPAHALVLDLDSGRSTVWRYWQLPRTEGESSGKAGINENELLEEFEYLFEDSIRRQMVADVPVGIMLSGGVDSSLVTAMASRTASKVKTFTIRFPGHEKYDETKHALLIARNFGTDHTELEAEASSVDLLPQLARQFDEPVVDSSMIPTYLVSRLIRNHCTVALGGDGGDELFGGYGHYNRLLWMQKWLGWIPPVIRSQTAAFAGRMLPPGMKGRKSLMGLGAAQQGGIMLLTSYFDTSLRSRLLERDTLRRITRTAENIYQSRIPDIPDLLQRSTRTDFENYLANDILVKVDRASMLNSLEVRAPLLDYRIIEFAFGKVPSTLKASVTGRKILPKKLASRVLPPEFDLHRKQGFCIPLAKWLQAGPWRDFFVEVLLGSRDTIFNRRFIAGLLQDQPISSLNSERLFALTFFELWRKEYGATF